MTPRFSDRKQCGVAPFVLAVPDFYIHIIFYTYVRKSQPLSCKINKSFNIIYRDFSGH